MTPKRKAPKIVLQAHPVGGVGGQQQPGQHGCENVGREPAPPLVDIHQPAQERADYREHHARVDRDQEQPELLAAGTGDRDHDGQHRPGQRVVDRGAAGRDAADPGAEHAAVGEDARQHGKRGDRHGCAHEQREREHVRDVMAAGQPRAQPGPQ